MRLLEKGNRVEFDPADTETSWRVPLGAKGTVSTYQEVEDTSVGVRFDGIDGVRFVYAIDLRLAESE